MIEDNGYSADWHIHRLHAFRRVFITGDIHVAADWVGYCAGGQSRSEEASRYLSGEFNAGWIVAVEFLQGADGKGVRKNAGEG